MGKFSVLHRRRCVGGGQLSIVCATHSTYCSWFWWLQDIDRFILIIYIRENRRTTRITNFCYSIVSCGCVYVCMCVCVSLYVCIVYTLCEVHSIRLTKGKFAASFSVVLCWVHVCKCAWCDIGTGNYAIKFVFPLLFTNPHQSRDLFTSWNFPTKSVHSR